MDKNNDEKLTYEEFVNGVKQDAAIAQVSPFPSHVRISGVELVTAGSFFVWWFCMIHSSAVPRSVLLLRLRNEKDTC